MPMFICIDGRFLTTNDKSCPLNNQIHFIIATTDEHAASLAFHQLGVPDPIVFGWSLRLLNRLKRQQTNYWTNYAKSGILPNWSTRLNMDLTE